MCMTAEKYEGNGISDGGIHIAKVKLACWFHGLTVSCSPEYRMATRSDQT